MEFHVLPHIESTIIMFVSFDLWMFRGGVDTFVLVINYLDETWTPRHAIVGMFKLHETSSNAMAL